MKNKKKTELKKVEEIQDPVIQRRVRMEQLSTKIVKLIESESKENGTFSIFEIVEVFVKLIHAYNKNFLNNEHGNLREQN